jgi:class 3 adenylate cyclase/tetratricopeptide (TPR) repeat protein
MDCPACGQPNRADAAFCDRCGRGLASACTACGRELRADARFCDACGQSVPAAAPDPRTYTPPHLAERILRDRASLERERRNVSVLFVDAAGSVATGERIERADPEELHRVVRECTEMMVEAVHRYEGTVTQFRGDGIMAIFGAPIAHEDSAYRAVAAAVAVRDALASYAAEMQARERRSFTYRIGINSGPVIVGHIGDDLRMDYTAIGDTVNLASRMEQWAAPGAVYVTAATQRLAAPYFEFRDLGMLEVKGKAELVNVFEVVRELGARTRLDAAAERGLSPYVGRERERSLLHAYFGEAKAGRGQVVFVSGEAGIGKSRLLLEFRRSLDEGSHRWIEGHCASYGRNIPHLPIVDLVRRAFSISEGADDETITDSVDGRTATWEPAARAAVPYLKFLLNVDPGVDGIAEMDPALRRLGVLDGMRALVTQESRSAPLVVVVEDLHWLDENSDRAIATLVDAAASTPLLLILTYRPGYAHTLGDRTYYSHLSLQHLRPDESATFADGVLGGLKLPDAVTELIIARSDGNPFFMEEVAKALLESGAIRAADGHYVLTRPIGEVTVPETIQDVILTRIDRLDQEAKQAIQLASVIGREFTVRLLHRVSDIEARLEGVLSELKGLELIYEKAYFPELAYMFKHALTHQVALSTLLASRRKALHRIVAAAAEELYSDRLPEQYEMLAHHYYEADDWGKALAYCTRAAEKAAAAYANADAIRFYDRALDAAEQLRDWNTCFEEGRRAAHIGFLLGEFGTAARIAERMRAAMSALGDRRREAEALIYRGIAELWNHAFSAAEAAIREAEHVAGAGHDDVRWLARLWLWVTWVIASELEKAAKLEEEVTEFPEGIEDPYHRDWWAVMMSGRLYWQCRYDEALAVMERSQTHRPREADVAAWIGVVVERGFALMAMGNYQRALDDFREALEACELVGEMPYRGRIHNCIGWIYGELQDPEQAALWNLRSIEAAKAMNAPDPEIENNARLNLADNLITLGRLDEADEHIRHVERIVREPSDAERWALWIYSGHCLHTAGVLALRRGDASRALAYADECIEHAERTRRRKNRAKGLRLRAQALFAQGDVRSAATAMAEAVAAARDAGNPGQIWETHVAMGDLQRARGDAAAAQASYAEALSVIEGVAANLTEEALRDTFLGSALVTSLRDRARAPV